MSDVLVTTSPEVTRLVTTQVPAVTIVTEEDVANTVVTSGEEVSIVTTVPGSVTTFGLVTEGPQGIQGVPGPVSGNAYLTAGTNLGGQRVIATDTSGLAQYADNQTLYKTVSGISRVAVSSSEQVEVISFGIIFDSFWNWDVTKDIFLGQNGLIVQDVPGTGAIVNLGHVVNTTTIFLNIDDFVERG